MLVEHGCVLVDPGLGGRALSAAWDRAILHCRRRLLFVSAGLQAHDEATFRLELSVRRALGALAADAGFEVNSYMQRLLRLHALTLPQISQEDGQNALTVEERELIRWSQWLIDAAVRKAREMEAAGAFNEHFTLLVIRALFQDPEFAANYAKVEASTARDIGVSAKAALNMALGFHIKSAVGALAETVNDVPKGKPKRVQVRGEAIQSYTLLKRPDPKKASE